MKISPERNKKQALLSLSDLNSAFNAQAESIKIEKEKVERAKALD